MTEPARTLRHWSSYRPQHDDDCRSFRCVECDGTGLYHGDWRLQHHPFQPEPCTCGLAALLVSPSRREAVSTDDGPFCRDCADVSGICPNSGKFCNAIFEAHCQQRLIASSRREEEQTDHARLEPASAVAPESLTHATTTEPRLNTNELPLHDIIAALYYVKLGPTSNARERVVAELLIEHLQSGQWVIGRVDSDVTNQINELADQLGYHGTVPLSEASGPSQSEAQEKSVAPFADLPESPKRNAALDAWRQKP